MENNKRLSFDIKYVKNADSIANITAFLDDKVVELEKFNLLVGKSRSSFLDKVAEKTGFNYAEIDKILIEAIHKAEQDRKNQKSEPATNALDNTPEDIKTEAMEMLKSKDLFSSIESDIEKIGIAGEKDLSKQLYLIMTSRLLGKPLAGIIFGASASGKSYTIETIAKLMPEESVLHAHDITNEALYYMEEGSLIHKTVIAGERLEDKKTGGKAEDNTKSLREMLASGKLTKLSTTKDKSGQLKTKRIEQSGPIAYLESTTSNKIHDEDATRLLPLITDESPLQTEIISTAIKNAAAGMTIDTFAVDKIVLKHKTAQRILRQINIRIPFADCLNLPCDMVSTRRALPQLFSFIKTVALLRQFQKEIKIDNGIEFIEADTTDYRIAYEQISKILTRVYSPIDTKSLEFLGKVKENTKDISGDAFNEFTIPKAAIWSGISESGIRRRIKELVNHGIIEETTVKKPYVYKLTGQDLVKQANLNLIDPEELEERLAIKSF